MSKTNRYTQLLEHVFLSKYSEGDREVTFAREELIGAAEVLGVALPKNLGDLLYSFRYRVDLPASIANLAPPNHEWVILPAGIARYSFIATTLASVRPNHGLAETKIPDATPGVIGMYALSDEQALLAKLRYNRLVDIFTGLTCYPLQSHLRTTVKGLGQVETDELYIGVNRSGAHFVLPVQAKRGNDVLSIVQAWQDWKLAMEKFPGLGCRPLAAQFMDDDLIALFEFVPSGELLKIQSERHYRLVEPKQLSAEELQSYQALGE